MGKGDAWDIPIKQRARVQVRSLKHSGSRWCSPVRGHKEVCPPTALQPELKQPAVPAAPLLRPVGAREGLGTAAPAALAPSGFAFCFSNTASGSAVRFPAGARVLSRGLLANPQPYFFILRNNPFLTPVVFPSVTTYGQTF